MIDLETLQQALDERSSQLIDTLTAVATRASAESELASSSDALRGAPAEIARSGPIDPSLTVCSFLPSNILLYGLVLYSVLPATWAARVDVRPSARVKTTYLALNDLLGDVLPKNMTMRDESQRSFSRRAARADVITFTGDPANGRTLFAAMSSPRPVMLGFGSGPNPFVVGPAADPGATARALLEARLFNCGQDCLCPDVTFVHESLREEFTASLISMLSTVPVGPRTDPGLVICPLTYPDAAQNALEYIDRHQEHLVWQGDNPGEEHFVPASVFVRPEGYEPVVQELFSPVLEIVPYRDPAQVRTWFEEPAQLQNGFYVSIFGEPALDSVPVLGTTINCGAGSAFDAENGNEPFGGFGVDASWVQDDNGIESRPLLLSAEAARLSRPSATVTHEPAGSLSARSRAPVAGSADSGNQPTSVAHSDAAYRVSTTRSMSAVITPHGCWDAAAMSELTDSITRELERLPRHVRAVLLDPEPARFVASMAACRRLGLVALVGHVSDDATHLPAHAKSRGPDAEMDVPRSDDGCPLPTVAGTNIETIFLTAGTSSRPTAIPHSAAAMRFQAEATATRMEISQDSVLGAALPLDHAYGYSVANVAAAFGADLHIFSPRRRQAIAEAIMRDSLDTLDTIPMVWRYLATQARQNPALRNGLRRLRIRGVGGQLLAPSLSTEYEELGAPLHNGYGLSEAGPNVAINAGQGQRPVSVGRPLEGVRVTIQHDGEILVKSPSVSPYLWDHGLQLNLAVSATGWLHTRDIGELRDGALFVRGRLSTLIHRNGEKIAPESIQESLHQHLPEEVRVLVTGVSLGLDSGDGIAVIAVIKDGSDARSTVDLVRSAVAALQPPLTATRVLAVPEADIPVARAGKIAQAGVRALAERLSRGTDESSTLIA